MQSYRITISLGLLKTVRKAHGKSLPEATKMAKVLDFVSKKQQTNEQKRRSFERLLFSNLLGSYTTINNEDGVIHPVSLVDISYDGLLFEMSQNPANKKMPYKKDNDLTLRMYFTNDSYMPVVAKIMHGKEVVKEDGTTYWQFGCKFDKETASFPALNSFIEFLYKFSEVSTIDQKTKKVYFL